MDFWDRVLAITRRFILDCKEKGMSKEDAIYIIDHFKSAMFGAAGEDAANQYQKNVELILNEIYPEDAQQ